MEAEKTKDFIKGAIASATENAVEKWGARYNSRHEAWAVLQEEIEEANEALFKIGTIQHVLWNLTRADEKDTKKMRDNLHYLQDHAQELATEAVQIGAVVQKFIDTLEDA